MHLDILHRSVCICTSAVCSSRADQTRGMAGISCTMEKHMPIVEQRESLRVPA